ncbi:hypothetical protein DZ900_027245, partial [Pseudomonas aeruginosa]|uniref:hypothetical protein n=1 Tax=Pseudomonas aeruginosa TaxID=287 RepID=UPI000EE7A01B|nr:hypothetical protein [Pseudomonas aeruginosa]
RLPRICRKRVSPAWTHSGLALLMILGLAPAGIGYTLLVALLGVGLLALLWPIGRLATRWCYADQLAA